MSADGVATEHVERGDDRLAVHVYPEPAGTSDAPTVVIWPAMGVPARYYRQFAGWLRERGTAAVVVDLRGTGASTPPPSRRSRYGYAELVADIGEVLAALKPRLAGRRTVLLGHSLGGQACALRLALTERPEVDGLVLVAVGLPYWRTYPRARRLGVLAMTQGIAAMSGALGVWPGWGFGGRQARGVIRDWAYTARTGRFPRVDGVDAEAAMRRITTPVLAVSVADDRYTPAASLDHLCAKLTAAPVRREHYTPAEAGGPLDHFRWARAGAPLATRVATFARDLP